MAARWPLLEGVTLQTMINVRLRDGSDWKANAWPTLRAEQELGAAGRLIRASGTEPVMVEATPRCRRCAERWPRQPPGLTGRPTRDRSSRPGLSRGWQPTRHMRRRGTGLCRDGRRDGRLCWPTPGRS
jgi:hypothetical protein